MKLTTIGRYWDPRGAGTPRAKHPVAWGEWQMLEDPMRARRAVAEQIALAFGEGADVVCLPGSSVPTRHVDEVPKEILRASRGGIVVRQHR